MPSPLRCFYLVLLCCIFGCTNLPAQNLNYSGHPFYISLNGNDLNPGTLQRPWKTIQAVNKAKFHAGDKILFAGGSVFTGTLILDSADQGSSASPIQIGSFGKGHAVIDAGFETGILIKRSAHIRLSGLTIRGKGRKNGNRGRGIFLLGVNHIIIDSVDVAGFQKSGIEVDDATFVQIRYAEIHDNGYAGISVAGSQSLKTENRHIYIGHCNAVNNPGDPTELKNHSGNGIVVGLATDVLIEYCTATANGWDMPRKGNGPVGIWAWESDSVTIQHCISYRNRTATGAMDGGGFDLDGGVTHSIVQYNLSYENEGSGFGIFQYAGATPWYDNIFRYNLSYNDGNKTKGAASVLWWNGTSDSLQFHHCYFYNNLLYNNSGFVLGLVPGQYQNSFFFFANNIFIGKDELMTGGRINQERFIGNAWWSLRSGFRLNGYSSYYNWAQNTGKEISNSKVTGTNADPQLMDPKPPYITDPGRLNALTGFKLKPGSPLRNRGIRLNKMALPGDKRLDFFGNPVPTGSACEPGISELGQF
jgi:hypothetical protein